MAHTGKLQSQVSSFYCNFFFFFNQGVHAHMCTLEWIGYALQEFNRKTDFVRAQYTLWVQSEEAGPVSPLCDAVGAVVLSPACAKGKLHIPGAAGQCGGNSLTQGCVICKMHPTVTPSSQLCQKAQTSARILCSVFSAFLSFPFSLVPFPFLFHHINAHILGAVMKCEGVYLDRSQNSILGGDLKAALCQVLISHESAGRTDCHKKITRLFHL